MIEHLTSGVHTLAIKTRGMIDVPEKFKDAVICSSRSSGEEIITTCILNLNKIEGDIFSYSRFNELFFIFIDSIGIDTYEIVRADMRFDLYNPEHYQKYAKLNRYLISLLAVAYNVRNTYRTMDLFSQKQLSVAIKNKYFECENYDKRAESNGADIAASRLEERSKCLRGTDLKKEFTEHWPRRWDKALEKIDLVHKRYNDELERIYREGINSYPVKFNGLTNFLIQYQYCIFCKEQMIDLLSRLEEVGPEKAKVRAKNHKTRCGIEYYSEKDVKQAVAEIQRSALAFFNS